MSFRSSLSVLSTWRNEHGKVKTCFIFRTQPALPIPQRSWWLKNSHPPHSSARESERKITFEAWRWCWNGSKGTITNEPRRRQMVLCRKAQPWKSCVLCVTKDRAFIIFWQWLDPVIVPHCVRCLNSTIGKRSALTVFGLKLQLLVYAALSFSYYCMRP